MKHLKILGLLAATAAALMALTGTASAMLTSPVGTPYGGEVAATASNFQFDGTVKIECKHSEIRWKLVNAAGEDTPGSTTGKVEKWTFTECSRSKTVTGTGHISIASDGTLRSSGLRVTLQTTILGFPVHCIYKTENTQVGTLTEGVAPAVWHVGSAPIPQEATSGACGNDAVWTGTYTITNPTGAVVVD